MRHLLKFLASLWLTSGLLVACSSPGVAPPVAAQAVEVAAGVYMVQGAAGEADTNNLGRIGNAGFIVGSEGVIAIDTGTSYRHAQVLLALIRRVTAKPVRLALITHTRQEFLFGAAAFQEHGIPVSMHSQAAGLMRARCERCLKTLNTLLSASEMQGTAMFKPDHEFEDSYALDTIGRRVQVLYYGHSSGPGDIAVLDAQTGVLFAGGLIDHWRIPDVQDSDLAGWSRALHALRALPVQVVLPGHGPVATAAAIDAVQRYLDSLQTRVAALLDSGTSLLDLPDAATLPEFTSWEQYETIHKRNAAIVFVRLEREQLFKQAATPN